ncbi:lytic transglycosylase domain-containing protein [Oleiagrimonas sp.]|uniref:lytic transglycosylase domain-containing protein n=1 Tax=Oleiagrimonas sp. TaxID=2010330 RepID=UPI00260EDAAF|nr:lytic transglycosylase domain-containing protein [Oleiagrimonas sp.]MDA3914865.1 transglycosylase SLT domain-containing protein [Oleiagrimonas sp.]
MSKPSPPAAASSTINEQQINTLYSQLDQASSSYQEALQLARSGDQVKAEHTLDTALDSLKTSAAQCGDTPGCDPQRFFSVFDHLLRLKDGSFIAGDEGDTLPDTPESGVSGDSESPVITALPQSQRSVTLLRGHKLSDLIAMNGPVKAAIEEWLTWLRPELMHAYVNYEYMRYRMWPAYHKAGLPEAILFGILAKESGGKVHAVSRSGAAGPLQFMYSTGRRFGLTTVNGFDERFDPTLSAKANAAYMNEQLKQFNDNLELTLAAYNGGEGRVRRLVGGDPSVSFYDPKIYFSLPAETRDYVPMVLAAAWLFMHPRRYHLKFPRLDVRPGHIQLTRPASLSELTVCLGEVGGMRDGWFRVLRNLNPRLNPQTEQPEGKRLQVPRVLEKAYARSCQAGGHWTQLAAELHAASDPTMPASMRSRHYRVRRGDTLSGIVKRLGCSSVHRVARMNHLRAPRYAIRAGHTLRLPRCH